MKGIGIKDELFGGGISIKYLGKAAVQIDRYVCKKTYLLKVSCSIYHFYYNLLFR